MNPDTNRFEELRPEIQESLKNQSKEIERRLRQMQRQLEEDPTYGKPVLLRPNGTPVPEHWSVFTVGENVVIKNYTFHVAHIGESHILFEPVGPVVVGELPLCPECRQRDAVRVGTKMDPGGTGYYCSYCDMSWER